jgi:hypothetical protein
MIQPALISILVVAVGASQAGKKPGTKHMIDNQKRLQEAQTFADKFEASREPDWLEKAHGALEDVVWNAERDLKARAEIRLRELDIRLRLVDLLDRHIDPAFDENDTPRKLIDPPALSDRTQGSLRPGASPSLLSDPKLRSEYEQAIAANRAKIKRYEFQLDLRFLDQSIRPRAHKFVASAYKTTPEDRDEVKKAIERNIHSSWEKAILLKLPIFGHPAPIPR